ncbi:MAG: hypothetical protein IPL96_01175 [Holophagaceae bacterium]|nr:hypothetical protein [Holophagaceae bacterium]
MNLPSELAGLLQRYRADPESVFHTWFLGEDRLKAFRTIRRGVMEVVQDIQAGRFPNEFRGSSLEVVMTAVAEQKQVFEGAAHAFYWKPKLRIPDIYENRENQLAFGRALNEALKATDESSLLSVIARLDLAKIKGLGPAVANILYFLHPTIVSPFNTAILRGYNAVMGSQLKLGSWEDYLHMREGVLGINHESGLSKDLGALAGFLFDVGIGKLAVEGNVAQALSFESQKVQKALAKRHEEVAQEAREANEHARMQAHLLKIGRALGYQVWVARNDRSALNCHGGTLGEGCLESLPISHLVPDVRSTVEFIDVLWVDGSRIVCAFEVEKSTSIYSGILRLLDLDLSFQYDGLALYLVAPDARDGEVRAQLARPSFRGLLQRPALIAFSDLERDCEALCRYGQNHEALRKLARIV